MNQKNVDAIVAVLAASTGDIRISAYGPEAEWEIADVSLLDVARALASRGALIPSALTDAECELAAEDAQAAEAFDRSTARDPDDFRAVLERIAKGTP